MQRTNIEWATHVWNPITGCSPASEGCANCYAAGIARRFKTPWGKPILRDKMHEPLSLRKPARIFVNSMFDLFHEDVKDEWIDDVFAIMALASGVHCQLQKPEYYPNHTFIVLTKRAERMAAYLNDRNTRKWDDAIRRILDEKDDTLNAHKMNWRGGFVALGKLVSGPLPNLWLGVSVENQERADERIPLLLQTPAAVRFVSVEPMLGDIDIGLQSATCDCCERWSSRWIMLNREVKADFAFTEKERLALAPPGIYRASSNKHGALCVPTPGGNLGVKPREFHCLPGLDWVICGPETGPKARPFNLDWARSLRDQCKAAGVPFFFKGVGKDYLINGVKHFEFPEAKA